MSSNASEDHVAAFLQGSGFTVAPIPRAHKSAGRTADFFVGDTAHSYRVEVTEKEPQHEYRSFLANLRREGAAFLPRTMDGQKRIADAIDDKADQLRRTPVDADFSVMWITAFHSDAPFFFEALLRTLYGAADLHEIQDPQGVLAGRVELAIKEYLCFYYDFCPLELHLDLQAVGFSAEGLELLFVNGLSPVAAQFRTTALVSAFAARGALVDPSGGVPPCGPNVLFMDLDVDRTDDRARWRALKQKYGVRASRTRDACVQSALQIPVETPNDAT